MTDSTKQPTQQFFMRYRQYILTGAVVLVAIIVLVAKYYDYIVNPWTRNGQVRAEVIQIVPRVTGEIVKLPIKDNQFVKKGDLLFEIDPRVYIVALNQAQAELDEAIDNYNALVKQVESNEAQIKVALHAINYSQATIEATEATIEKNRSEYERQKELLPKKATSMKAVESAKANYDVSLEQKKSAVANLGQSQGSLLVAEANLAQAKANLGAKGDANAKIRAAQAALEQAQLNVEFTKVLAPTDGYVTNLNLRVGGQAVSNQALLALVDTNSYWIAGYFKETLVGKFCKGNQAMVTLMTYPSTPIEGYVENIGWGIAQDDGSTGFELLPNVNPTFEWIRLAQRIPVNIRLTNVPPNVALRVGATASVVVYSEKCTLEDTQG